MALWGELITLRNYLVVLSETIKNISIRNSTVTIFYFLIFSSLLFSCGFQPYKFETYSLLPKGRG